MQHLKKYSTQSNQKGFTMVEALFSLAMTVLFLGSVFSVWYFTGRTWGEERVKSELKFQLETTMERVKKEIRLSDGNKMFFYPVTAGTYTAISFPQAIPDSNGFLSLSGGSIAWNKTVVYHVYDYGGTGPTELRKTVFNYNSALTNAQRQAQLNQVVQDGNGANATDGATSTTETLFVNLVDLDIKPGVVQFDGYSATTERSESFSLGSISLAAGNHTIRFNVIGKNSSSSGYSIGIDSLSFSPSGAVREAENMLPPTASSGDSATAENMTSYGTQWTGNYQLLYSADAVGDFVTLTTYYDMWQESNFTGSVLDKTSITGTNPQITLSTREDQGLSSAWSASNQTGVTPVDGSTNLSGTSVRTVIEGTQINSSTTMIRIKFMASSIATADFKISEAYFGLRSGSTSSMTTLNQLHFSNPTVAPGGTDGVGVVGSGPDVIDIPPGHYVWSNWFEYSIDASNPVPDHIISYSVTASGGGGGSVTEWIAPAGSNNQSYLVNGQKANQADWSGETVTDSLTIYSSAEIASWVSAGTVQSAIYDTKLSAPAYSQATWTAVTPAGTSILLKFRTSSDPQMAGATAWSALTGSSTSPMNLSGLAQSRYIQFQATLSTSSPYTSYPTLDDVTVTWPGVTSLVEVSGFFTKRPNNGIFTVLIDGVPPIKSLEIRLEVFDSFRGKTFSQVLNTEATPRNTGS